MARDIARPPLTLRRWLALMFPTITGEDYETYLQQSIFKPLGMSNTTFYPFGPEWDDRLMPLRFGKGAVPEPADLVASKASDGDITWEPLTNQLDLLKLPRT